MAGVINEMLIAMRAAPVSNTRVLEQACRGLNSICADHGVLIHKSIDRKLVQYTNCEYFHVFVDENRILAGKAGAIDTLVAVMKANINQSSVILQASASMRYLCRNGAIDLLVGVTFGRREQAVGWKSWSHQ